MEILKNVPGAPPAIGPYSRAVRSGGFVFCSGQIGLHGNDLVAGGIEAETKQVLANLSLVLTSAGLAPSNIVMTTIFLTDLKNFAVVNELYGAWVNGDAPPARQTVGVRELPKGACVEISVIAEAS